MVGCGAGGASRRRFCEAAKRASSLRPCRSSTAVTVASDSLAGLPRERRRPPSRRAFVPYTKRRDLQVAPQRKGEAFRRGAFDSRFSRPTDPRDSDGLGDCGTETPFFVPCKLCFPPTRGRGRVATEMQPKRANCRLRVLGNSFVPGETPVHRCRPGQSYPVKRLPCHLTFLDGLVPVSAYVRKFAFDFETPRLSSGPIRLREDGEVLIFRFDHDIGTVYFVSGHFR